MAEEIKNENDIKKRIAEYVEDVQRLDKSLQKDWEHFFELLTTSDNFFSKLDAIRHFRQEMQNYECSLTNYFKPFVSEDFIRRYVQEQTK